MQAEATQSANKIMSVCRQKRRGSIIMIALKRLKKQTMRARQIQGTKLNLNGHPRSLPNLYKSNLLNLTTILRQAYLVIKRMKVNQESIQVSLMMIMKWQTENIMKTSPSFAKLEIKLELSITLQIQLETMNAMPNQVRVL